METLQHFWIFFWDTFCHDLVISLLRSFLFASEISPFLMRVWGREIGHSFVQVLDRLQKHMLVNGEIPYPHRFFSGQFISGHFLWDFCAQIWVTKRHPISSSPNIWFHGLKPCTPISPLPPRLLVKKQHPINKDQQSCISWLQSEKSIVNP